MVRLLAAMALLLLSGLPACCQLPALHSLTQLRDEITRRESSSDPDWRNGNRDARPIEPGETLVIADLQGPGEITHIWCTVAAAEPQYSRLLVLRMYWDGETRPSVECPLGDFFGLGHGWDVSFDSLPVRVTANGRARNCYWVMPFRKSARITVTNEGRVRVRSFYYIVNWRQLPTLPPNTPYFHAMYRQEFPTVMGRNYLIADIEGRGHYVGTVLSCRQLSKWWWGEGDDFFFIDGEQEPGLRGTGTEDYFCDAWGFRQHSGPFYGVPLMEGESVGARSSAFRWHINDPISFRKSLRLEIEHKGATVKPDGSMQSGFEEREDDFSSVAFWYQLEPHKSYPPLPTGYARVFHTVANGGTEAETLVDKVTVTAGKVERQELPLFSGGAQLFWTPDSEGQALSIPVEVKQYGRHVLFLLTTYSFDYGIFQVELNGKPLEVTFDLYARNPFLHEQVVELGFLEPGSYTLTLRNRGKNEASRGYHLGIDALFVRQMAR